jgi:ribonuclease P protein component
MLATKNRLPVCILGLIGRTLRAKYFTIKISHNSVINSRVGIIVSKRVDKRAVVRNRVRRRIAAIMYELLPGVQAGYDMLFIVNKELIILSQKDLIQEIKLVLSKQGIYSG